MTESRLFIFISCAVVASVAFATGASAEEGIIYACAQKNSGDLRIVESPDDCRKPEVALWWNQVGPAGDPGPPGAPGESANLDVHQLADLVGQPELAVGLPLDMTHPMECTASLVFEGPGGATADVVGLIGTDTVSQAFAYHVVVENISAASSGWLGLMGQVTFTRDEGTTTFGGMISEIGTSGDDDGTGYTVITLEPPVAGLARNADYRVFQDRSVLEIVASVMADAGLDFQDQAVGSYEPVDCMVQYNESDLDFVKRLTEGAGVFFFFDPDGDPVFSDPGGGFGGGGPSLDYPGAAVPLPPGEEAITTFIRNGWFTANRATVRGFDFEGPALTIQGSISVEDGSREVFSYDASIKENSHADLRANVNLQRLRVPFDVASGTSTSADVRAGFGLAVSDTSGNGMGGAYNVTEVTHVFVWSRDGCLSYGNVFEAVPEGIAYRPPKLTPVPKVQGLHTAFVTGAAGTTVDADYLGRVIVQFQWDRLGGLDENSFCRVRVNQPAGSLGMGDPFIPPVGQEVLVGFVQGDPSQPVVIGSLFNGDEPPLP